MSSFVWILTCLFCLTPFVAGSVSDYSVEFEEDTDVEDRTFPSETLVYNRRVTCGKIQKGMKFPAQTWTCADARVDGQRLAYGLFPGLGVDGKCTETKGLDELAEICNIMMNSIDVNKPLWAAFVTNATCDVHHDKRRYLNKTVSGYGWADLGPGHGWIDTFRCMAER